MMECIVFGGVILDRYLEMETYPQRGQDELISKDYSMAGGCSINMAATFNNLGGSAHMVSYVGCDSTGQEIMAYLDNYSFSKKYIKQVEGDTGYSIVVLEKNGERTFMTKKGVESAFGQELFSEDDSNIKNVMVTGYYLLSENVQDIIVSLEKIRKGCDFFLFDPGPLFYKIDPVVLEKVLSMANIIALNEFEAEFIKIPRDASKIVVIKKGKSGGKVFCGTESFDYQAKIVNAIDTTGAGDSFAAGLMFGLISGMDVHSSVSLAIECSAKTVTIKGPHGFWRR